MSARRILAIFAHPDDESFGPGATLARYARQDVEVHICIATDGAAGSFEPGTFNGGASALAKQRRAELEAAVRILGATLHPLDYRDSGMEGAPDNDHPASLYRAPLDRVIGDLIRLIRAVQPQIVITHDPTGGYFHPDHIKINQAATQAFFDAARADRNPGPAYAWHADRLYYTVIRKATLAWKIRLLRLTGRDPRRFGRNHDIDLTRVGIPDSAIHARIPVGPYLKIKEAAMRCHRSQGGGTTNWLSRWINRYDYFIQAYPANPVPHHDLFGP